jgi:hypothetical protein
LLSPGVERGAKLLLWPIPLSMHMERGQGVRCRRDPFNEESYRAEPPEEPKAGW